MCRTRPRRIPPKMETGGVEICNFPMSHTAICDVISIQEIQNLRCVRQEYHRNLPNPQESKAVCGKTKKISQKKKSKKKIRICSADKSFFQGMKTMRRLDLVIYLVHHMKTIQTTPSGHFFYRLILRSDWRGLTLGRKRKK